MDFEELIARRYSVRAYKADSVPEELLGKVLEAARLAPTAANRQPFQVYVVDTSGREEELRRVYHRHWFTQAPLVLCVCTVPAQAWVRIKFDSKCYADVDAAIVMDHMILAAAAGGLGTCWIADFNPVAAREVLQLPEGVEPVLFTPLFADEPKPKERKTLAELVEMRARRSRSDPMRQRIGYVRRDTAGSQVRDDLVAMSPKSGNLA
jgi:nitroreductase